MSVRLRELQLEHEKAENAFKRQWELEEMLRQLYHHHNSQAKPGVTPVSKQYNQDIGDRIGRYLFPETSKRNDIEG